MDIEKEILAAMEILPDDCTLVDVAGLVFPNQRLYSPSLGATKTYNRIYSGLKKLEVKGVITSRVGWEKRRRFFTLIKKTEVKPPTNLLDEAIRLFISKRPSYKYQKDATLIKRDYHHLFGDLPLEKITAAVVNQAIHDGRFNSIKGNRHSTMAKTKLGFIFRLRTIFQEAKDAKLINTNPLVNPLVDLVLQKWNIESKREGKSATRKRGKPIAKVSLWRKVVNFFCGC